jgi:hypothetical protein
LRPEICVALYCIITGKQKAALGRWSEGTPLFGIEYHASLRILGVTFENTVALSTADSSRLVTGAIRHQAREAYCRDLDLNFRVKYVNQFLKAKAWHLAQIFPPPVDTVAQINTVLSWFLWKGNIFRVPLSTLYRTTHGGGWALIHMDAKCRTLLMCRLYTMYNRGDTDWTLAPAVGHFFPQR